MGRMFNQRETEGGVDKSKSSQRAKSIIKSLTFSVSVCIIIEHWRYWQQMCVLSIAYCEGGNNMWSQSVNVFDPYAAIMDASKKVNTLNEADSRENEE